MSDGVYVLLVLAIAGTLVSVLSVFATYKYETDSDWLVMKWYLPGGIRLAKRRIRLADIAEAKRSIRGDHLPWSYTFGNPFASVRVVLVMKSPYWRIARHVILTPREPESLVTRLEERLRGMLEKDNGK